ncbi:hypothetical protein [Chitinophaga nivalis]|uniref:Uncharacterized protein n=1 Tax=Chitinophaga nivalis TaxID=2991709 RepID=A0ABT3IRP1_9BACT|nr:hypothetical protein [Chitinophaga nivalis]MCW3463672.1 hypothetical protein [Chitinophaga nivalis]MCW3486638.1 hypothetical protein [Chitinophaga nivalis]
MRLIGFIKEYEENLGGALFEEIQEASVNDPELINKIIAYLDKGKLVMAWMGYFMDLKTKDYILPHDYRTDGIWIWPSYFPYYLRFYPNYKLDKEFVDYLIEKDFLLETKKKINVRELENELIKKMSQS